MEILKDLDCDINFTRDGSLSCENTKYKSWLINDQYWWTKTAGFDSIRTVFLVGRTGILYSSVSDLDNVGIRPVITISKESLKNYLEG